jgi:hypothetical protein
MQTTVCNAARTRANTVTRRELHALAKRLATSQRVELRAIARTLGKALAGEIAPHFSPGLHVPIGCAECGPLTWAAWAIGVAFAHGEPEIDLALPVTDRENWAAEIIRRARDNEPSPALWWTEAPQGRWSREAYWAHLTAWSRATETGHEIAHEIRFGTDPRKARAAQRASLRKEMDLSCLMHR